jgi:hypothetical protein
LPRLHHSETVFAAAAAASQPIAWLGFFAGSKAGRCDLELDGALVCFEAFRLGMDGLDLACRKFMTMSLVQGLCAVEVMLEFKAGWIRNLFGKKHHRETFSNCFVGLKHSRCTQVCEAQRRRGPRQQQRPQQQQQQKQQQQQQQK